MGAEPPGGPALAGTDELKKRGPARAPNRQKAKAVRALPLRPAPVISRNKLLRAQDLREALRPSTGPPERKRADLTCFPAMETWFQGVL